MLYKAVWCWFKERLVVWALPLSRELFKRDTAFLARATEGASGVLASRSLTCLPLHPEQVELFDNFP